MQFYLYKVITRFKAVRNLGLLGLNHYRGFLVFADQSLQTVASFLTHLVHISNLLQSFLDGYLKHTNIRAFMYIVFPLVF